MMRRGWINDFCFEQSEILRKQNLTSFTQINRTNTYNKFKQYLKVKDRKFILKLGSVESKYLETLLIATIARHLWDNNTYYKILSQEDKYIKEAINNL